MIWICVDRENDSLCEYTENKIVLSFYEIKYCLYELLNGTLWLMKIGTLLWARK